MAKESYIERLQRERQELVDYARQVQRWKGAIDHLNVTGRKGSARQEVVKQEKEEEEQFKKIKQYLDE